MASLATLYSMTGRRAEAEWPVKRALGIAETSLGPHHAITGQILEHYAFVLRQMKREREAKQFDKRARTIQERHSRDNLMHHTEDVSDALAR